MGFGREENDGPDLPGSDALPYAFRHYRDRGYLAIVASLKPGLVFALGEHLPAPPSTSGTAL